MDYVASTNKTFFQQFLFDSIPIYLILFLVC